MNRGNPPKSKMMQVKDRTTGLSLHFFTPSEHNPLLYFRIPAGPSWLLKQPQSIAYMILPLSFTELIFTSSEKLPKGANAGINGLMWQQLKCSLFYIVQIEGICISSIKFVHVLTKFKSSSSFLQTFFLCKRLLTFEVFLPSLLIPDKPNITDTYTSGIWTTYAASKILCDYKRKNCHVVVYSDDLNEQECNFSFETLRGCWLFLRHLYVQGFQ